MPRALNESEVLEFFHEMGRISIPLSPSGAGGAVVLWESHGIPVLDFRGEDGRDYLSDLSDLTPAQISNLGLPAIAHGQWYYLPGAIVDVIAELPANLAREAQWVADKVGQVAGGLTAPLVGQLSLPLIAIGIIALVYFSKR